jgi:hypothetical protein
MQHAWKTKINLGTFTLVKWEQTHTKKMNVYRAV